MIPDNYEKLFQFFCEIEIITMLVLMEIMLQLMMLSITPTKVSSTLATKYRRY